MTGVCAINLTHTYIAWHHIHTPWLYIHTVCTHMHAHNVTINRSSTAPVWYRLKPVLSWTPPPPHVEVRHLHTQLFMDLLVLGSLLAFTLHALYGVQLEPLWVQLDHHTYTHTYTLSEVEHGHYIPSHQIRNHFRLTVLCKTHNWGNATVYTASLDLWPQNVVCVYMCMKLS